MGHTLRKKQVDRPQQAICYTADRKIYSIGYDGKITTNVLFEDKDGKIKIIYDAEGNLLKIGEADQAFVKGDELKTQLQKNVDALTQLQTDFNSWTPVPNDGGAALKTILTSGFLTKAIASLTDILSELIKGE